MNGDMHSHDHEPGDGSAQRSRPVTAETAVAPVDAPAASPKAAPGALDLIRSFVNTNDRADGRDRFDRPDGVTGWLVEHGLPGADAIIGEADVRRVVAVREALRDLLLANNEGGLPDAGAIRVLTAAGRRTRVAPVFAADGSARLAAAGRGVDAAIGHLLSIVVAAMENGTWPRLKACRNDTCRWAFYDHSKNRSGAWCTMSVCGSQVKARTYRRRHKTATTEKLR
jgi:predicted RNA-binding Zn ribbon-like protein